MSNTKVVVVDCANHMLGRVASTVAKQLVNGQKVVCVRTEELCMSGSLFRNQLIFGKFLIHRGSTKPSRGPNHYRSPARLLYRTIRGMTNHFKERGQAALGRLKAFEGCPHPYDKVKKVVIPGALRVLRLRPGRKYCRLGDLSAEVGWSHNDLVTRLEKARKIKAAAWYQTKLQLNKLKRKATEAVDAKLGLAKPPKPAAAAKPKEQKGGNRPPKKAGAGGKDAKDNKESKQGAKPADKKPAGGKPADKKPTGKPETGKDKGGKAPAPAPAAGGKK